MPIIKIHPVNTVVARLVQDEVRQTIQRCADNLEAWIAAPTETGAEGGLLEAIGRDLDQVRGAMAILQLEGGQLLVESLGQACTLLPGRDARPRKKLAARISQGLLAIPLYFDYVLASSREIPFTILSTINELRMEAGEPIVPETHFAEPAFLQCPIPVIQGTAVPADAAVQGDLQEALPGVRHMYSTGLVGLLRQRHQRLSLRLMKRAADQMVVLLEGRQASTGWQAASMLFECWLFTHMENTVARRRVCMALDAVLRRLAQDASLADAPADEALLRELLFLVALSGYRAAHVQQWLDAAGIDTGGWTDQKIATERSRMYGKTRETVESVARELRLELSRAQRLIERLASGDASPAVLKALGARLKQIADAVGLVGLPESADVLWDNLATLKSWYLGESQPDTAAILSIADSLLFVECRFAEIEGLAPMSEVPAHAEQMFLVSRRMLMDAQRIVIRECLVGLHDAKAVISVYIENAFDESKLSAVDGMLRQVRGGLAMLGQERPAAILASATEFAAALQHGSIPDSDLPRLMGALADVLVTLEHYLEEYEITRSVRPEVLDIADKSLQALEQASASYA